MIDVFLSMNEGMKRFKCTNLKKHFFQSMQPFEALQLPFKLRYLPPRPSWCNLSGNEIIVSTDYDDDNPGIYKYDITTNKHTLLSTYPSYQQPDGHAQFVDHRNSNLHILGGDNNTRFTFNLKTKQFKYPNPNLWLELMECDNQSEVVHVSTSKKNEVHLLLDLTF